jgi:cell wall-active antibiotic response 4TMS protein YvqF
MKRENPWTRLVTGFAILAVGVILWLDHLNKLNARDYLQWWSLLVIASGIAHLIERRWLGGAILIVFGSAFLPRIPFFPHLHLGQILGMWPLLISVAGVTLVMQALQPPKDPRAAMFRSIAVMGGSGRSIGANEYVAGDAVAVMGGCDIDFTPSTNLREAVMDVLVFWGGIEIKVPRGWRVELRAAPILGAVVLNAARPANSDAPRLVIRGSVIMGALEVKNPKEATL